MQPTSLFDRAGVFSLAFDELEPGARFATPTRSISDEDVMIFSALTGDRHPQHLDERWAASSAFGRRIAHGMLVLSIAVGLLPLDPERVVALRRVRDAVFKRPVRLGDTVRVNGRIDALAEIDASTGLVTCALTVVNQEDQTVARALAEVLWRRASDSGYWSEIAAPSVLPL